MRSVRVVPSSAQKTGIVQRRIPARLIAVESPLLPALHGYEAAMIAHGFKAVRAALLYTQLAISQRHLLRAAARPFFRICGSVSPRRRAIFRES
jgi:hypothetical protein